MSDVTLKFIYHTSETRVDMTMPKNIRVLEVKKRLFENWPEEFDPCHAASSLRLIFQGRIMDDSSFLKDYRLNFDAPNPCHVSINPLAEAKSQKQVNAGVTEKPSQEPNQRSSSCCVIL
eukprot:GCRY01001232.1.p2 GENE.GCRY01001232.1~~GCRY01001232.1.p2  ORF type:complete len:119 (+),score=12.05 GCRY01001232.1:270-626(+)